MFAVYCYNIYDMKKPIHLLFIACCSLLTAHAQTLTDADVRAAANNRFETLLIGVDAADAATDIQYFTYQKTQWEARWNDCGTDCDSYLVASQPVKGQAYRHLRFTVHSDKGITKRIAFTGDFDLLVSFFTEFWSRTVSLQDIQPGEVATTRFLTDVAAFSVDGRGNAQIEVTAAADRS